MTITLDTLITARVKATETTRAGACITLLREALGLNQQQFAKQAGLSGTTLSNAEKGKHSDDTLMAAAAALPTAFSGALVSIITDGMRMDGVPEFARPAALQGITEAMAAKVAELRAAQQARTPGTASALVLQQEDVPLSGITLPADTGVQVEGDGVTQDLEGAA